jgi:hypothetical protein
MLRSHVFTRLVVHFGYTDQHILYMFGLTSALFDHVSRPRTVQRG